MVSYRWPIDIKPVSRTVFEILSIKYFGGQDFDRLGSRDVTGHVAVRPQGVVSYKGKADDLYRGSMQFENHRRTALQYPLVHWRAIRRF